MPNYFLCNDREIDDPQTIANEFNSYFENCCKIALESMPSQATSSSSFDTYLTGNFVKSVFFKPINECELIAVCKSLKTSYSYDVDYYETRHLFSCKIFVTYFQSVFTNWHSST